MSLSHQSKPTSDLTLLARLAALAMSALIPVAVMVSSTALATDAARNTSRANAGNAHGAATFLSGERRVALVELYTSEGCSSCPPADRWLSRFVDDPRLWKEVVPIAFHVDYWDYLGWPDRFANRAFSARQRAYARGGNISQVYTPGLVVEGREWRGWFRGARITPDRAVVGSLEVTSTPGGMTALFEPAGQDLPAGKLKFNVALLAFGITSAVEAGENHGRTLEHDFVVLALRTAAMNRSGADRNWASEVRIDGHERTGGRLAFAAWVSAGDDQTPIQATGGWLN